MRLGMREKVHTAICMVLVLVIFTGCRGGGAFLRAAFAVGYVALRTAAVAAAAHHDSSDAPPEPATTAANACSCNPVPRGSTWCEQTADGTAQCAIECDPGFVFRDGVCAQESTFSRTAAAQSLERAIESAQECKATGNPIGPSHARITFAPSGEVTDVVLEPPYAGTAVGQCIEQKLRRASVPDFDGDAVTVGKNFTLAD